MNLVQAKDISFKYASRPIIQDLSFTILQGEVLSLLGPNGSGKTTLLKVLLGLVRPQGGTVTIQGKPLQSYSTKDLAQIIAYVPQVHRIAFSYTVEEVVQMGRVAHYGLFGRVTAHDKRIAHEAMERLKIRHLAKSRYSEISGGERQLTLIARALTQGAKILILDEPLNGLDYGNQIHVLEQITRLSREGYTCIKTTHFPDHALWMASRVILLNQGRIIADGKPDSVLTTEVLSALYRAEVAVVTIADGVRSCIPQTILHHLPVPETNTAFVR